MAKIATETINFPAALDEIKQTLGQAPYDLGELKEQAALSFDSNMAEIVVEYLVDAFQVEEMED